MFQIMLTISHQHLMVVFGLQLALSSPRLVSDGNRWFWVDLRGFKWFAVLVFTLNFYG